MLDRLKPTGKLTVRKTNKFSIITLIEYDCNIEFDRQNDSPTTGKRQASDKPTLLYKENKNIRNQETAHADACGGVGLEKNIKKVHQALMRKALSASGAVIPERGITEQLTAAVIRSIIKTDV